MIFSKLQVTGFCNTTHPYILPLITFVKKVACFLSFSKVRYYLYIQITEMVIRLKILDISIIFRIFVKTNLKIRL